MSDGVAITAGVGTTVLTDDTGAGGHAQVVKLAYSTDGSGTLILADAKGLEVQQATAADLNITEGSASAIKTAVELIDDVVYVDDTATHTTAVSKGIGIMGVATPTDGSVGANEYGQLAMTVDRKLHVAVMDALPAGSAAIGKLAANSGVDIGDVTLTANSGIDIGDVDVTSIIPGTGATNLGKAEDGGHTTGDVGVMPLGVRNDADASFGADLDYTPMSTDAGGNQNVRSRKQLVKIAVTSSGLTTTATAYASGDQLGTEMTFAGAARASGGGGMIVGAMLISAADTIGPIDLVITNRAIGEAADNAAFAISDADALFIEAYINLAGAYDIGNNRIAFANNLAIPYTCNATSLFVNMITRFAIAATPFAAGTDIQLNLYVELN